MKFSKENLPTLTQQKLITDLKICSLNKYIKIITEVILKGQTIINNGERQTEEQVIKTLHKNDLNVDTLKEILDNNKGTLEIKREGVQIIFKIR